MTHIPTCASQVAACRGRWAVLFIAALTTSSTGCSVLSGFRGDFNSNCCCRIEAAPLAGCWEGCWESHTTGHKGKLQAIITRCDETHFRARFHGTFFKVLPFAYSTQFVAADEGPIQQFTGRQDLGRLAGGTYHYAGQATDCDFVATYTTCKDHGVFRMRRHCH